MTHSYSVTTSINLIEGKLHPSLFLPSWALMLQQKSLPDIFCKFEVLRAVSFIFFSEEHSGACCCHVRNRIPKVLRFRCCRFASYFVFYFYIYTKVVCWKYHFIHIPFLTFEHRWLLLPIHQMLLLQQHRLRRVRNVMSKSEVAVILFFYPIYSVSPLQVYFFWYHM